MASFDIVIIGQSGRIEAEALLLAASLRAHAPGFSNRLLVAEPQPGPLWPEDPRMSAEGRAMLGELGAEILPFESRHFGSAYPHGNKIEALSALPASPFLFLDSDTLILGEIGELPIATLPPAASMRREGTWPVEEVYWPGYTASWKSLYDRFGLDFESSLDLSWPDEFWKRYLYFNAGWFHGADPVEFGARFRDWALAVRDEPGDALACQSLDPWLDQIVLPLVIHSFGGGRPGPDLAGLDGAVTCHYRNLPLLYAKQSDTAVEVLEAAVAHRRIKKRLREWTPAKRLIYQGKGREKVRTMFDRRALPTKEQPIRNQLRKKGWWLV